MQDVPLRTVAISRSRTVGWSQGSEVFERNHIRASVRNDGRVFIGSANADPPDDARNWEGTCPECAKDLDCATPLNSLLQGRSPSVADSFARVQIESTKHRGVLYTQGVRGFCSRFNRGANIPSCDAVSTRRGAKKRGLV